MYQRAAPIRSPPTPQSSCISINPSAFTHVLSGCVCHTGVTKETDRQRNIIYYLVHQGKGRTEAARFTVFAAPRQSAFTLTQSPKIIFPELAGDNGKHSQSLRNYDQNLAEMTPDKLSAIFDSWKGEKATILLLSNFLWMWVCLRYFTKWQIYIRYWYNKIRNN